MGLYKHSLPQSCQPFPAFVLALADNNRIFVMVTAAECKCLFPLSRQPGSVKAKTDSEERLNKPGLLSLAVAREASRELNQKTGIK